MRPRHRARRRRVLRRIHGARRQRASRRRRRGRRRAGQLHPACRRRRHGRFHRRCRPARAHVRWSHLRRSRVFDEPPGHLGASHGRGDASRSHRLRRVRRNLGRRRELLGADRHLATRCPIGGRRGPRHGLHLLRRSARPEPGARRGQEPRRAVGQAAGRHDGPGLRGSDQRQSRAPRQREARMGGRHRRF